MDFGLSATTEDLLTRYGEFLERHVLPLEATTLGRSFTAAESALEEARAAARSLGLWGPQIPEELGGLGLGLVDYALVSEVVGASPLGHYAVGAQAPDAGNLELLWEHGSGEQKERWLRPLAAGELRSCFSMTERERPGSNPVDLATTAERDGNGYVINGEKWYTTAADGAAFAVVMAVTDPDAAPHRRASMLIVPTGTPGFEIVRNIPVMGHAGDGWASHSEIRYRQCRVPLNHRIGEESAGFQLAQDRLGPGRIHHCMRWLGIARRVLDLMCERAATRRIAEGEVLGDRDIVRAWIAECEADRLASRWMTLATAWRIERDGWRAARGEISAIKFHVAAMLGRVLDRALQVHGSLGMSDDTPIAWFFREERAARIYDGPDEVHKIALARRMLRDFG